MSNIKLFESKQIRTHWDGKEQQWYFSIIDVVEVLTNSSNPRDYWFKMKVRVKMEDGLELSTICRQLKLKANDGKMRETDVAHTQSLLRIIQSIPSPKAEPFKQWLAKVGYERIREINNPAESIDRARENWQKLGRSEKWIQQRMTGQETRNKLTDYWKDAGISNTGTNVSVVFIDKSKTTNTVILVDASKLGTKVKDGKNQKTLLSADDENKIIDTINSNEVVEDFSIVIDNEKIKGKNYSFGAGQYFDTKIEYSELTPDEFDEKMREHQRNLEKYFAKGKNLENQISNNFKVLSYE